MPASRFDFYVFVFIKINETVENINVYFSRTYIYTCINLTSFCRALINSYLFPCWNSRGEQARIIP